MLERLFPKREIRSVYGFDFHKAYAEGIRGLLFDTDNTLVPHDAPADARYEALAANLFAMGFHVMIVSNNRDARVRAFTEKTGIPYICDAHKPSPKGYLEACRRMGVSPDQTLFFGDQIFTDIWGANNAGIESILVEPIDKRTDLFKIRLKRILEKPILWMYHRRQKQLRQAAR